MTHITAHATRRLLLDHRAMRAAEQDALAAYRRAQEQRAVFLESLFHLVELRMRARPQTERPLP